MPRPSATSPSRAAVVGGGVGGLSAAIHLQRAGLDVTVYEARDRVGGRANLIEEGGFRFDTGPSLLNYPWVFEELFAACGRRLSDEVRLFAVEPSIRFLWPDGTHFTLSSRLDRLRAECERLEPGASAGLMAFLADAEAKYNLAFRKLIRSNVDNPLAWLGALAPWEWLRSAAWRSFSAELERFFRSRHICEALGSYAMYLGGSPRSLPGLFTILPYGELAYGLWLPEGGIYGLVQAVERLARDAGVQIETGVRVERILTQGGRVTGLELRGGTRTDWPIVVSNVDVPTTELELLGRTKKTSRSLEMTPGVITFYWGIRGRIEGLGHHTIFLPHDFRESFDDLVKRGRLSEAPPFYLSVPSETDRSLAPPGDTTAFVLVPTPRLSELGPIDWKAATAALRARIMTRLRDHGATISPDQLVVERVWTPETWGSAFGLHDGSAFGAAHTLLQLGPLRPRNADRRIRGLYYTGASTTPGTGLPMVVLSGEMTARRVLGDAR